MASSESTQHYAHEAEATRERLAHNLDELSDRLTLGQVFDEVMTYTTGGGGTFMRAFSNATRQNPVPSLLIGAGCLMFLSEKLGLNRRMARRMDGDGWGDAALPTDETDEYASSAAAAIDRSTDRAAHTGARARRLKDSATSGGRRAADFASAQGRKVSDATRQGAAAVGDAMSAATDTAKSTAQDMRDRAADAASQAAEGAQSMAETAQEYSSAMGQQAYDLAASAQERAMRATTNLKDAAVSFIYEQPLLCAAMGVAVGAAIAAMLPSTQTEDELMGETSDSVKAVLGEAASDQFKTTKDAAGAVLRETKAAAEREGLTPTAAGEAMRSVGEKAKNVAQQAASAGSSQMENRTSQMGQSPSGRESTKPSEDFPAGGPERK